MGPADLWSDILQQELISSEETGQQGSITHAYASVMAKHGARLSQEQIKLLRAVVLASKLGLLVGSKEDAVQALAELAAVPRNDAGRQIRLLQEEYNVIEWDEAFKAFDILGDAVPRTQFLAFIRQRVASSYDETGKATIFASRAAEWCDLLVDLGCDFAEENRISTREWRYSAVTSSLDYLAQQIKIASDRWVAAVDVDEARGTIIYTYVGQSCFSDDVMQETGRLLRTASRDAGFTALPVLVVVLHDFDGALGQALAEYAVLQDINEAESVKFGNLIGAHKEKLLKAVREKVDTLIKERRYLTALKDDLPDQRLSQVGTELFKRIYKNPVSFPFDGFSTAKGNAAETCHELTLGLMHGKLDYDGVMAMPVKVKNRAVTVLKETWGIFNKNGSVSRRPAHPVIRSLTEKWDDVLSKEQKLPIAEAVKQFCRPPFGANLASAGLFMGAYIAPRYEELVVLKDGVQLSISQWIQDGVFRGKFINLAAFHGVDLMKLGEASSEWEALLDEWEQCENHLARKSALERSRELKRRVPIPPLMVYRAEHLSEQALASITAIQDKEKAIDEALSKMPRGEEKHDVSLLSWGAAALKRLSDKMAAEESLWTDSDINEIKPHYERARQAVVLFFPEWLARQKPLNDAPDKVGDFKHKMLDLIGGNLKKIGLDAQYATLEKHTLYMLRNISALAEANQLLRDVESWITCNHDAVKNVRVNEIKNLQKTGKDYASKLQGVAQRIELSQIAETRSRLSSFLAELKAAEDVIKKRASTLWQSKILSETDMDRLLGEVESLVTAYDNLPADLEDLHLMQRALRLYRRAYQDLSSDNLSWKEFEGLADKMRQECAAVLGGEELPWPPDEAIDGFVENIARQRKVASATWISSVEAQAEAIPSMPADEANRLHNRVSNSPPVVTETHLKRASVVVKKVEARLVVLAVEWLLEKYKELSPKAQKDFLQQLQKLGAEE